MASSNGKNGANGKDETRMAGDLGLTGFTLNTRGRGVGLTYAGTQPQFGGTAQFGAGGGGNYIDFKPIISQVASPAIQAAGGDIIKEKGKGGVTTESGKGGINKGDGGGGGGLPSIADSGFDPAAYGAKGLGMKDYKELQSRGYSDQEIKKYAKGADVRVGERLQDKLGLGGGGKPPTGGGTDDSVEETKDNLIARSDVRVKDLGLGSFEGKSAAKDLLASFRGVTGGKGAKKAENISDKRINRLLNQAGISTFDTRKDASKLTSFLAGRSKPAQTAKQAQRETARERIDAAKARTEAGKPNVVGQIRREIKQATGKTPTRQELSKFVARAKVGKNLGKADVKKVVRAAKKAKKFNQNKNKNRK